MGGYGSGRTGRRAKVEHCRSLDVNRLHKGGCLVPGYQGGWQWTQDGEKVASITLRAEEGALVLDYRRRAWDSEDWQPINYRVPIERVPVRHGGTRPYFRCPGVVGGRHCGRRVAKLYLGGLYYLCRHCLNLTYRSRSETRWDRLLRRRDKLCVDLGGEPGCMPPPRPAGMHWATYECHLDTYWRLEAELDVEMDRRFLKQFPGLRGSF